jgi:endonuclease/exonuclease/phosphatase family metal-dependent hydrolase
LLGLALALRAAPSPSAPIRVTTWDLQPSAAAGTNGWSKTFQQSLVHEAAQRLKKLRPDVILLQQVADWETCHQLAQALQPETYQVVICSSFRDPHGKLLRRQVAILSKAKAYQTWAEPWQKRSASPAPPGGFAFAAINLGEKNIGIFSVLLSDAHSSGAEESRSPQWQEARSESARQLVQQIALLQGWRNNRPQTFVVAGDFNTTPDDWRLVHEQTLSLLQQSGFDNAFGGLPLEKRVTLPGNALRPAATLDYIFTRDAGLVAPPLTTPSAFCDHESVTCEMDLAMPKAAPAPPPQIVSKTAPTPLRLAVSKANLEPPPLAMSKATPVPLPLAAPKRPPGPPPLAVADAILAPSSLAVSNATAATPPPAASNIPPATAPLAAPKTPPTPPLLAASNATAAPPLLARSNVPPATPPLSSPNGPPTSPLLAASNATAAPAPLVVRAELPPAKPSANPANRASAPDVLVKATTPAASPQALLWLAGFLAAGLALFVFARKLVRQSEQAPVADPAPDLQAGTGAGMATPQADQDFFSPPSESPPYVRIEMEGSTQTQSQTWPPRKDDQRVTARMNEGVRAGVIANLSRWLKEKAVQRLVSDRAQLLAMQEAAGLKVLAVDQRLARIEHQIQQINHDYERRIDDLLRELIAAKEENRELIRAKITLVKAEMERARVRVGQHTREHQEF